MVRLETIYASKIHFYFGFYQCEHILQYIVRCFLSSSSVDDSDDDDDDDACMVQNKSKTAIEASGVPFAEKLVAETTRPVEK